MYDYSKLIGRIVERYGSRKAYAEELQLSETSLSKKLNGLTGFSQEDIILWCKLLDINNVDIGIYFFVLKV